MFPFPSKPGSRPTFEDVFFEHRTRLYEWALQLTGRDHSDAEDLVQELFVRFAGAGPVGEHIENPEDYLFSTLRNLHYARLRRARTSAIDDLSVVDYDSAERGLRAVDRNGVLFIREDLHRVCDYLCERKESSRAASIFILRYFLGYFPNEVVQVARTTRSAVDKAIRAARNEARLDLDRPGVLQQMAGARESKSRTSKAPTDSQGLFLALRTKIFRSCTGECFSRSLLEAKYKDNDQSFTTAELAHLVSCAGCLDRANRLLGLPLLEERSPDETIGRDTPQGPDGSAGATPTLVSSRAKRKAEDPQRFRKRMQRCLEEVNQHRPQHLLIAVDGDIRASQRVTAQFSELRAELRPMEKPTFIEVLSEQGVCLAFVLVQAPVPEGGLQQTKEVRLSDDRTMKVAVSFTAESPTIQVVYNDPLIAPEVDVEEESLKAVSVPAPKFEGIPASDNRWEIIFRFLPARLRRWLTHLPHPRMNPLLAGAMLFALCSVVCFILWTKSGPRISATTLLARAEQSDAAVLQSAHSEVIYQKVRITTSRHTTERAIYRDPQKKRRPKQQHLSPDDQWLKDKLNLAGVNWDEPLSAANYSEWHDRQRMKQDVVTQSGSNLLTLTTSATEGGPVLKESITVRESDFHPVDRTIELRDTGTVEIAELNYDVMPWGAVNQDWFEPLAGNAVTDVPAMHAAIHIPHVLSDLELDEAELSARVVLNQLHADTGEQIHLTRSSSGIDIKGVVDTDVRKRELVSHLASLPNVHPSILSVEEIGSRPQHPTFGNDQPVQVQSVEAQPSPLEQYLRENKLPLDQLGTISQNLFDQSLRIQQAEVHLAELQQRFAGGKQLSVDQQQQLTELARDYINTIHSGLEENQRTLRSIGLDNGEQVASPAPSVSSGEDIDRQIHRYQELCRQLISSGTGEPQSAPTIATQLRTSGSLIRSGTAQIYASVSTAHN
ncbi:RNA polymerase sigma factor [Paracidobacterium acidisoli]|uniref:RNA polymerase sigma factor n=1 Tax=Paracidobacterium acidisoli TaxID=2303751 RepID=A0A372INA6_9BACT|nr:RNA polymerase sigma factor [Paracidobacterium acidisoli]MBT9332031.1 RNA polymerase sigma factor [Paracidobacterium acidisoli]